VVVSSKTKYRLETDSEEVARAKVEKSSFWTWNTESTKN